MRSVGGNHGQGGYPSPLMHEPFSMARCMDASKQGLEYVRRSVLWGGNYDTHTAGLLLLRVTWILEEEEEEGGAEEAE